MNLDWVVIDANAAAASLPPGGAGSHAVFAFYPVLGLAVTDFPQERISEARTPCSFSIRSTKPGGTGASGFADDEFFRDQLLPPFRFWLLALPHHQFQGLPGHPIGRERERR